MDTQQTSPVGQLSELVQVSDTPGHSPMGAHAAPPPPPPIEMQHSSLVGSHVVVPQAMGVSGMPLSPMVPPSTLEPPSSGGRPLSVVVLPSTPEPPSREPPLPEPEPLLEPPPDPLPEPLPEPPLLLDLPPSPLSSPDRPLTSSSRTVLPPHPAMTTSAMSVPAYLMTCPFSLPR
jgi:hypothetical protein